MPAIISNPQSVNLKYLNTIPNTLWSHENHWNLRDASLSPLRAYKNRSLCLAWWHMLLTQVQALRRQRQRWRQMISEFKASMINKIRNRTVRNTQRNPVSGNQTNKQTNKIAAWIRAEMKGSNWCLDAKECSKIMQSGGERLLPSPT